MQPRPNFGFSPGPPSSLNPNAPMAATRAPFAQPHVGLPSTAQMGAPPGPFFQPPAARPTGLFQPPPMNAPPGPFPQPPAGPQSAPPTGAPPGPFFQPPAAPPTGFYQAPPMNAPSGPPSQPPAAPPTGLYQAPPMNAPPGPFAQPPAAPLSAPPTGAPPGPFFQPPAAPPTGFYQAPPMNAPSGPPSQPPVGPPAGLYPPPMGTASGHFSQPPAAPPAGPPTGVYQAPSAGPNGYPGQPQASPSTRSRSAARIDPEQIPRPLGAAEVIGEPGGKRYQTRSGTMPPAAGSTFCAIDQGNCNPRFMRMTVNQIPQDAALLNTSFIPLGLVIQPLAELSQYEEPLQIVDYGADGPVRCNRCKAYMNPHMTFIEGGKSYVCNLCNMTNEVPRPYHCSLDEFGQRRDRMERPELSRGSYEFVAPSDYSIRPPQPPMYLFVLDTSFYAITSGLFRQSIATIKSVLDYVPSSETARVGVMTYDTSLAFYNLKKTVGDPEMLIVSSVDDPFAPLPLESLVVNVNESRDKIDALLDKLPVLHQHSKTAHACFGSAAKAAYALLEPSGGKVLMFYSGLPSYGLGVLKNREDPKLYGTDKEKALFSAQDEFYSKLASQCTSKQICVDLYCCSPTYSDLATVGALSGMTGGQVFYYPGFNALRDGEKLHYDIVRNITRTTGFEAVMRVRCSTGLRVVDYFGNFTRHGSSDVDMAAVDSDKSFVVMLKHDDKLSDTREAGIQCALLYTSNTGQRRIRVHNLSLPITNTLSNLFRYADLDTIVNVQMRRSVQAALQQPLSTVREAFITNCVNMLYAYRDHCATSTSAGQLILPESLKLLPLFSCSILKSPAFRSGGEMHADERTFWWMLTNSMPVYLSVPLIYPRVIALHELPENAGRPSEVEGYINMPPTVAASSDKVSSEGVYLMEDGYHMFIYIGPHANPQFLQELFGNSAPDSGDISQFSLEKGQGTDLNERVSSIVRTIQSQRPSVYMQLRVTGPRDVLEMRFLSRLIEDKIGPEMSYVDFLCHVHKLIQAKYE